MRTLLLLHNRAETYPDGRAYAARVPGDQYRLPEIPEVMQPRGYNRIFVETPYLVPYTSSQARAVPLGQGELSWVVELAQQFGGTRENYTARHFPTRDGALLAGMTKAQLAALQKLLKPGGIIYPISLVGAYLSAQLKTAHIAFFVREGYALEVIADEGDVVEVVEVHEASLEPAWFKNEVLAQGRILGKSNPLLVFYDTALMELDGLRVLEKPLFAAELPPSLGWPAQVSRQDATRNLLGAGLAGLLLGLLPWFVINQGIRNAQAQIDILKSEIDLLRTRTALRPSLEKRRAFLRSVVNSSVSSEIRSHLEKLSEILPPEVSIVSISYEKNSGRMEVYSQNLAPLLTLSRELGRASARAELEQISQGAAGWKATLAVALTGE